MTHQKHYTHNWEETSSQTYFDLRVRQDICWDFSNVDKVFVGDDQMESIFWAAISIAAPPIEGFFLKVLRTYVTDNIGEDRKLVEDVQKMMAQEAAHSKAHRVLNEHLKRIGYDVDGVSKHYRQAIDKMVAGYDENDMLGVVSGGEHGLYSLATEFLNNPKFKKTFHPEVYKLFFYHMLEEAEHSAVSHDQYKVIVGPNFTHRVGTALRAGIHLIPMLNEGCSILFKSIYGRKMTFRERLGLFKIMFVTPGLATRLTIRLLPYLMPWYDLSQKQETMEEIQGFHESLYLMDEVTRQNAELKLSLAQNS